MVQLSTPWAGVTANRGMGPPRGAFCQITLTSCLHAVGHPPLYHHHHAPIYMKPSTVNVSKIDSGSVKVRNMG